MLYILPPPSAPSPPSPWTTILCGSGGGSEGSASGSGGSVRGGIVRTAAGGAVATVVQSSSWGTVTGTSKRPPSARGRALRNPKNRVSSIFEGCCYYRVIHLCNPILGAVLSVHDEQTLRVTILQCKLIIVQLVNVRVIRRNVQCSQQIALEPWCTQVESFSHCHCLLR